MSAEPVAKKTKMVNTLEQLKKLTTIVADSGDFEGKFFNFKYLVLSALWSEKWNCKYSSRWLVMTLDWIVEQNR